jgi:hypothetical protein
VGGDARDDSLLSERGRSGALEDEHEKRGLDQRERRHIRLMRLLQLLRQTWFRISRSKFRAAPPDMV